MAGEALYYGTGRRKNAVARVRLVPGTGKVTINGREGAEYFGREALLDYAKTPFKVTDTMDHFDVIARINGGGISGQAGALRHGISRALLDAGDYRAELKKAGYQCHIDRVIAVEMGDTPGSLDAILKNLEEANVSLDYLYISYDRQASQPVVIFKTREPEAETFLRGKGYKLVDKF